MIEFYFLSNIVLLLFFVFAAVMASFQAAYTWIIACNNLKNRIFEFISELLLLLVCFMLAREPVVVMIFRQHGIVFVNTYSTIFAFIAIPCMASFLYRVLQKEIQNILPLIAIFLSFPLLVQTQVYLLLYILSVSILFARALHAVMQEQQRKKTNISEFSIKQGMDSLPAGVLFAGDDGHIFLVNTQMLTLMERYFGKEHRNAIKFWEEILSGTAQNAELNLFKNTVLLRSEEDTWRFTRRHFKVDKTMYVEIIATDITQTDKNFLSLEADKIKLLEQNEEIKTLNENMAALQERQEYTRIRTQIHDIMGQRLTAIQRMIQTQNGKDYVQIAPLLHNLVESIREERMHSAVESFLELKLFFERVGIVIDLEGNLPNNDTIAYIFLSALREATTNASRHAKATKMSVKIRETHKAYTLAIQNNGKKPTEIGKEGLGLLGIRNRVESQGGTVNIEWLPRFKIKIKMDKS